MAVTSSAAVHGVLASLRPISAIRNVEGTVPGSAGLCFAPDHEDDALKAQSLNHGDRAALEVPGIAGLCFAPDHEDDDLKAQSLNHGDQAILALV
jgi:hypothetical protein